MCQGVRAVLRPPGHPLRWRADAGHPARRADPGLHLVLGHQRAGRRWGGSDTCRLSIAATGASPSPRPHPVHRLGDTPRCGPGRPPGPRWPRLAGLLAGLAVRPASQGPVLGRGRLLGVGAVGARRPVGVRRVPTRPASQPHDPVGQHHRLRLQLGGQQIPCRQLGLVQLGLGGGHRSQLAVDRTLARQHRAQLVDRQGGQFAQRLGHARHDRHPQSYGSTRAAHATLPKVTATASHPG